MSIGSIGAEFFSRLAGRDAARSVAADASRTADRALSSDALLARATAGAALPEGVSAADFANVQKWMPDALTQINYGEPMAIADARYGARVGSDGFLPFNVKAQFPDNTLQTFTGAVHPKLGIFHFDGFAPITVTH